MHSPLTDRQERFVIEYVKDQNASAAAARAGYAARNLAAQGSELMKNPAVRHRVRVEMQGLLAESRCSMLALMRHRMRAAFFRADRVFVRDWDPYTLEEMDEETRLAVEVTVTMRKTGPVVRLRQPCRARALRALERVHERLDVLNERYHAGLERAGVVVGVEDEGRVSADGIVEKDQVLSGLAADDSCVTASFDGLRTNGVEGGVTDGAAGEVTSDGASFPEKHQVLSGSEVDNSCRAASFDRLRTNGVGGEGADIPEKPQVLSGSAPVPGDPWAGESGEKHQVLSGSAGLPGNPWPDDFDEKHQVLSGRQPAARDAPVSA